MRHGDINGISEGLHRENATTTHSNSGEGRSFIIGNFIIKQFGARFNDEMTFVDFSLISTCFEAYLKCGKFSHIPKNSFIFYFFYRQ